jgi:hypothetical protein
MKLILSLAVLAAMASGVAQASFTFIIANAESDGCWCTNGSESPCDDDGTNPHPYKVYAITKDAWGNLVRNDTDNFCHSRSSARAALVELRSEGLCK